MTLRRGLPEQIAGSLGKQIVSGAIPSGASLPPEGDLMSTYEVSRPVLREAMKILASKGLIDVRQKIGTRATERERWSMLDGDVLAWHIAADVHSHELLLQLVEVREIIEPQACRLAAERGSDLQFRRISMAFDDMWSAIRAEDDEAFIDADLRFHGGIVEASNNLLLRQMNSTIASALRLSRDVTIQVPNSNTDAMPLHQAVLDRIVRRQAAAAMRAAERLIARTSSDIAAVVDGLSSDAEAHAG